MGVADSSRNGKTPARPDRGSFSSCETPTAKHQERHHIGDSTPVILLTERGEEEMRTRGLAAGATSYVSKPFAYGELVAEIFRLLQRAPQ